MGRGVPPAWLGGWFDPELDDLFRDDPSLGETARLLRASRPEAEPDVHYRNRLRASLMEEAAGTRRQRRGVTAWLRIGPGHLAWSGAAVGVVAIAATVLTLISSRPQDRQLVVASSTLTAQHAVSPNDVITVAFNQQMNQSAVVAGLRIEPATQVSTSWQGNDLVITPVHHLTGNTPYTVTITKPALVSAAGTTASAPVQITFGTAPTPPSGPGSATPPALTPATLGTAGSGAGVLFAPDGSVVTTAGVPAANGGTATPPAPAAASATPGTGIATPTALPSATPTPGATGTPTPAAPASPGNDLGAALLEYPNTGGSTVLGHAATAAAYAPGGGTIASAVPDSHGGSQIVVALVDGSKPVVLTDSASPVATLTWAANDRVLYATATMIQSVDLAGVTTTVAAPPGGRVISLLAPGGAYGYLAPQGGGSGQLWNIAAGTTRDLSGAGAGVAFSGDGQTIAWVDQSGAKPQLLTEAVTRDAPATVSTLDPGAAITTLALNNDGTEAAYVTSTGGATELVVAQVPTGATLATGPAAQQIAFARDGSRIALVLDGSAVPSVAVASLPGTSSAATSTLLPSAASTALHAFVDAQVRGDAATLATLSARGVNASGATPHGLSRGYIIEATPETDGSVTADVELLVDPTAAHTVASVTNEQLTLAPTGAGGAFVVTALNASPLQDQASGPHVVLVATAPASGGYTVQVNFDSDLNPATVAGAITVVSASGATLSGTVRYDADARSATVTLSEVPTGPVTVTVGTGLRDVNGQAPASAFTTRVGS